MISANNGYVLDNSGRVWRTSNGGKKWTELPGVGTGSGIALAFGSANSGYLTMRDYPADDGVAYVERTSDGGKHWRPQRIASGSFPGSEGVISPTAIRGYALTSTPAAGNGVFRSLFTTAIGGDAGFALVDLPHHGQEEAHEEGVEGRQGQDHGQRRAQGRDRAARRSSSPRARRARRTGASRS